MLSPQLTGCLLHEFLLSVPPEVPHTALRKNTPQHAFKSSFSLDPKQLEGGFCVCTSQVPAVQYGDQHIGPVLPKIIF